MTTGMPALTAFWIDVCSACGLAIETTRPPTFCATALSISLAWLPGIAVGVVVDADAQVLARLLAPFFTTFQKASPALPCVTTATFNGPPELGAAGAGELALLFELSALGPLQAERTSPAAAIAATPASFLKENTVTPLGPITGSR